MNEIELAVQKAIQQEQLRQAESTGAREGQLKTELERCETLLEMTLKMIRQLITDNAEPSSSRNGKRTDNPSRGRGMRFGTEMITDTSPGSGMRSKNGPLTPEGEAASKRILANQ